jgi:hypothetical protein
VTGTAQVTSKSGRKKTRPRSSLRRIIITQARIEQGVQEIINTTDWLLRAFLTGTIIVIIMTNDDRQKALAIFGLLKAVAPANAIAAIPNAI